MNEWTQATLQQVCTRITDGAHASPVSVSDGLPMASVKDLTRFGINIDSCRLISREDYGKLLRQGCRPQLDDVLIAKDGATALDTVCQVKLEHDVVLLSSVAILRPNQEKVVPAFLRYYLDASSTRSYMKGAFVSGAAIPRVVLQDFKRASISLPELPVQRKIAAFLSAYDDLIENNTRRIKILEDMAQTLYREWFVHFRFPGHEQSRMVESELGLIPEGWTKASFSEIAHVISGGTPKTTIPSYWDGDMPFFTPKDSPASVYVLDTEKTVTQEGLLKCSSKLFPKDTVFITARGTVGKMAMPASNMAMNQSCYALQGRGGISQYFLFMALQESVKELKQAATGAVFDTIVVDSFSRLHFAKPPEKLVEKWTDAATPIFQQLLALIKKNAVLRQTRDLLLPKLISGEVDVTEAEIVGSGE